MKWFESLLTLTTKDVTQSLRYCAPKPLNESTLPEVKIIASDASMGLITKRWGPDGPSCFILCLSLSLSFIYHSSILCSRSTDGGSLLLKHGAGWDTDTPQSYLIKTAISSSLRHHHCDDVLIKYLHKGKFAERSHVQTFDWRPVR